MFRLHTFNILKTLTIYFVICVISPINAIANSYPLYFPGAAEDLSFGNFWYTGGPHSGGAAANDIIGLEFDFNVQRWRAGDSLWEVPVHAAADGVVIAGWRGYPDNIDGSHPFDQVAAQEMGLNGGNNLIVLTDDGNIVFYAHLRQNSIPVSLLPQSTTTYPESSQFLGSFPEAYMVPVNQRKRIHLGQFLGKVGNSGNSSMPHLHIHVQQVTETALGEFFLGDTLPIRFYGASKVQNYTDGSVSENWSTLNGHVLNELAVSTGVAILPEESRRSGLSSRKTGRLDSVSRSKDRQLQLKIWNGIQWSGWTKLGGTLTSNPSCASWSQYRMDCFARGVNMRLNHKYWTQSGGWQDWSDYSGLLTSAPAVVARAEHRLDVFARGKDFALKQKFWDGGSWSAWTNLGGELSSAPACSSWSELRIDCVARGKNNHLWHIYWNGDQWSNWADLGGNLSSSPAIVSRSNNRLDIFARGANNHLWMKQWIGNRWTTWEDLGGTISSAPSVAAWSNSRIDVQAVGQNGNLWHLNWTVAGWGKWKDLGSFYQ